MKVIEVRKLERSPEVRQGKQGPRLLPASSKRTTCNSNARGEEGGGKREDNKVGKRGGGKEESERSG